MRVLHAFHETGAEAQADHLEFWFGYTHPEDRLEEDRDDPVVCFCGARLEPFAWNGDGDVSVAVVWHLDEYPSVRAKWLKDE